MLVNRVPSLLHMAAVKVAAIVYMREDIQDFEKNQIIRSFFNTRGERQWEMIVRQKLLPCALPTELQEKVIAIMKPLSFELNMWLKDHIQFVANRRYDIYIVWNSFGMIDRSKTAEGLINSNCLPIDHRIHLAVQYKMWTDLLDLFEEAPWYDEKSRLTLTREALSVYTNRLFPGFISNIKFLVERRQYPSQPPEWPTVGTVPKIFRLVEKLPSSNGFVLTEWLRRKDFICDDDRICLFNLDVGEREELLRKIPFRMLTLFLQWPLQTHFLEVVDHLWPYLKKEEFSKLLALIHSKIDEGWRDFGYIDLFKTFWSRSPLHFQDYVQKKNLLTQEASMPHSVIINNFLKKLSS
ncbi:uncharacterized protein TNCT_544721 [Trichonephila clavata]|uniref:Uncharacterized protein n=1 Tax=Trichonephila clavata TaxID=2740835 RepID=A0A8X6GH95_TRICU|nr:uncharacterized protein TNCT_544721 [Trichonephila clavata]